MDYKNENEFEQDQTNSSEITDSTHTEAFSNDPSDFENREGNRNAVDVEFTVEPVDSVNAGKSADSKAAVRLEEAAVPPVSEQTRITSQVEQEKPKKRNLKGFASTLAAGVIGSVLTLTILPHTDYIKSFYPNVENQVTSSSDNPVKPVSAQPAMASNGSIADTVEKVSKAIVGVVNFQQQQNNDVWGNSSSGQSVQAGSGSGVIFQKNNDIAFIVTNNHVVEGASKLEISLYDGQKTTAEVVGTDALTDLAVLKIEAKYVISTADFGDSAKLRPGDQVFAIGNPLGLNLSRTVTQGIVSAVDRSIPVSTSAGNWETNVIQTDAAINPGNSGGALINPQGQVIGINSLKISESGVEGLGFAIPSNDLIPIVNQLIKSGKVDRPYLGVGLADLDQVPQVYWQSLPNNVKQGVLVMNIDPNSTAARAGFQPKDVIVSMNGTKIANSSELRKYLYSKVKTGDEIKFEVYREGKLITLKAKLSANKGA
ncbi:S1C family serine protease [Neobacillus sp. NPDC093127]|uniref:S1C family serine protease n=1 Tax=Neobacillus sp. NPDC093127 TaxID=3364296 RepID=UPI003806A368